MAYSHPLPKTFLGISLSIALIASLTSGALAWPSIAAAREKSARILGSSHHFVETLSGREEFRVDQYFNSRGEKELAVYHEESRVFFDTEAIVLYGRDLDRDGAFDAWFVMGKGGVVQKLDRRSSEGDGWDIAEPLLRRNPGALKNRWLVRALFHWLNGYAGFAGRDYLDNMDRTQLNLYSAEIRTDRLAAADKKHPMIRSYYQQISTEWDRLGQELDKQLVVTLALDSAMVAGPVLVTKALTAVLARLGINLAGSPISLYFKKLYDSYVRAVIDVTKSSAARVAAKFRLSPKSRKIINQATGPFKLVATRASVRTEQLLQIMERHDILSRTMAHAFRNAMELGRAGLGFKTYIAQTQGVQLIAETFSRREELWDPNPLVLANRIGSDKDLLQNMAFMTGETFMLAGMSKLQPNIPKRLAVCAVLAVVNSVTMNYVIKGETDVERIKFDATWEAVIGNGQTLLDTAALGFSAHYAEKLKRPGLRLVGFAIAFVDQAIGYYSYAEKTKNFSAGQKQPTQGEHPVRFVPIFAPI